MMTIYALKPAFQRLLQPLVSVLAKAGVTPNQVTLIALLLSVLYGVGIALMADEPWIMLCMPFVLLVRMALNAVDGMLARGYAMQSDKGAMLNEMGDLLSDVALYLPLALLEGVSVFWVVMFVIVGILTEMAGVLVALIGAARRYDGPMGKSDRAVVIGAVSLLLGFGVAPGLWLEAVLGVSVLLGALTVLRRCERGLSCRRS